MFTYSFPPADDLISNLTKIEYKKHTRTFINACITIAALIAAIVTVIVQRCAQWYAQGGKDDLRKAYKNLRNFLDLCYTWIVCEGYPNTVKMIHSVQQTYHAWKDLVTV